MQNAKTVWRILVALKDGLVLGAMLLFFGFLFVGLISSPNPAGSRDGALLLDLKGTMVEQPDEVSPRELLVGQGSVMSQTRVRDVIRAIEAAITDDDTKTVVLDLDSFLGAGQVAITDVGAALDKVRAAKKPVLAFATGYSDDGYLLAAHASEVWLDPMGGIAFAGPGGTQPYFKGLIDRMGVNVHVYRVGKYKSFVEPYTRAEQSPEAKESNQALVDHLWAEWRANVAKARPKAQLDAAIANPVGTDGDLAKAALAYGLVDKIGNKDAFGKRVAELAGNDDDDKPAAYNNTNLAAWVLTNPESSRGDAIGIVHVAGEIVDGQAGAGTAGGDTIAGLIQTGLAKKNLKALVVRVDSPGGSAFASERIRLAMLDAKAKGLPVVVSMGNVAASGGYWVAMGGDTIFAEPATVTGSIGVFGILPTFENTAARYGVTGDGVRTTPLSGQPDILRGTTPEVDKFIQTGIENTYARFLSLVSAARKMPVEKVHELAQGRVWDGGSARQLGLVDSFGSLDDAVAEAAKRAKIDPTNVRRVWLENEPDFLTSFFTNAPPAATRVTHPDIISRLSARRQAQLMAGFRDAGQVIAGPAIQVRCISCPAPAPSMRAPAFLNFLLNRGI